MTESRITPAATALEIRDAVGAGRASAESVVRAALGRAEKLNPPLNAFIELYPDDAIARAIEIDRGLRDQRAGHKDTGRMPVPPLLGVPVAIKDNICLGPDCGYEHARTTCGSRILDYRSPYTATAAKMLLGAGAVIIGKTNMDEFAMGSSGEHSAFGPTRNPWDTHRVPGGSSAGSAAAVAAGIVPIALGSDTGGSIRQPAGLCGIVGMKPTYGRISRYGLVAFASSLDQIGPLARTVDDCALALSVLCGHEPLDSTYLDVPPPEPLDGADLAGHDLVIGIPAQARSSANHPAVAAAFQHAIDAFKSLGAATSDIDLHHTEHGIAAYYIIAPAEASSNLARYDGIRYGRRAALARDETLEDLYARSRAEGFGAEVRRRIMLGTHVLSSGYYDAYYNTALKVRRLIKRDFDDAFRSGCHAILLPSSPSPAFRIGEKLADPLALYLEDVYTVGVNLAGLPGITIPAGFAETESGTRLPVGVQLIAPALGEAMLLRIARMLAKALGHERQLAPLQA
jgi:aspartyl-tRNA(Asn)/glutamyl-tRNA(Gln) amidotransferase subunit A